MTFAAVPRRGMAALAATVRVGSSRQALHDSVAGKHASVHREISADHKGTHGGVFLGQNIRLVREICLVLSAIDEHQTGKAVVVPITLVRRIRPSSAATEAFQVLHVKSAHLDG